MCYSTILSFLKSISKKSNIMKELKPISTTLVEVTLFGVWGDGGQWFQPHNVTCRILVP